MSSEQGGKLEDVDEEGAYLGFEDVMGREGDRVEVSEYGAGGSGPLDRGSSNTPPHNGCNASGGLRLPLGGSEPLNQPSGNTPCAKVPFFPPC